MRTKTIERNIRLKRIYDPPDDDDGLRVLATRYWPRGVSKDLKDEYSTTLSPSRELLRAFKHEGLSWDGYAARFLDEMRSDKAQGEIRRLAEFARSHRITLMCICEDENRCHRSLLKRLIAEVVN